MAFNMFNFDDYYWDSYEEEKECPHCNQEVNKKIDIDKGVCTWCYKSFETGEREATKVYPYIYRGWDWENPTFEMGGVSMKRPSSDSKYDELEDGVAVIGHLDEGDVVYVVVGRHTEGRTGHQTQGHGQVIGIFSEYERSLAEKIYEMINKLAEGDYKDDDDFREEFYDYVKERVTRYGGFMYVRLNFPGYFERCTSAELHKYQLSQTWGIIKSTH